MHLMSLISPVDRDLAVVYSRLLPVPFRERSSPAASRSSTRPDEEFDSMGTNVLRLAPRRCLMLSGNPAHAPRARTRRRDGRGVRRQRDQPQGRRRPHLPHAPARALAMPPADRPSRGLCCVRIVARSRRSMIIRSVAVLGAGVMGSQIAAHFANAGVPSLLLDVTADAAAQG
jgi:hypothetical protein